MKENCKYDVFISYSRRDYADEEGNVIPGNVVSKIKSFLEEHNYTYWFDEEGIYSGDEFVGVISQAIEDSKVFIFISSKNSIEHSNYTAREIAMAVELGKKIIPFRIDNTRYKNTILFHLSTIDYIDYVKNQDNAFNKLEATLNKSIGVKPKTEEKWDTVIAEAKAYKKKIKELADDRNKVIGALVDMGITTNICPVCTNEVNIDASYCNKCGWTLSPTDNIKGEPALSLVNKVQLKVAKSIYNQAYNNGNISLPNNTLNEENTKLKEEIVLLKKQIQELLPPPTTDTTQQTEVSGEKIIKVGGVEFKMIKVEGGSFDMGATAEQGDDAYEWEKPVHRVTLDDYYIGETEVTQSLWEAVMGNNPSSFKGKNRPVESVSWNDCQEFIKKLNAKTGLEFRLPTEAEWEYAARGGKKSKGYKYSGSNTLSEVAWYKDEENRDYKTHDVKGKQPNELGIYDMSGNVWEWCSDWYGEYSSASQRNPQGPTERSLRVLRGGSWYGLARRCRVSDRDSINPDFRYYFFGLRLVLIVR